MLTKRKTKSGKRLDHVEQTVATYDRIAPHYIVTATTELRAWEEQSMRTFQAFLAGERVLVVGCGDGRDSRYLSSRSLTVISFDLSRSMLEIARGEDPTGTYLQLDMRHIDSLAGPFDGIWASGCLYHLKKSEFAEFMRRCPRLLSSKGVLYLCMKEGQGERFEARPGPGYPGGERAVELLKGKRFYAYYSRSELLSYFEGFEVIKEDRVLGHGGFEYWLRKRETIC